MRGRRRIGDEVFAGRCDTVAAHVEPERAVARDQHADEIGHRRAGDEEPARALRKVEQFAQPVHDLPLDLDRHVIAAAEIGVEPGGEHFRQHSRHVAAAMHPAHEAGMHIAGGVRENVAHERIVHGGKIARPARKFFAQTRAHAVRDRLPDRARADVLDVIENIVEHPVALRAGAMPIRGIEIAAGCREKPWCHRTGKFSLID